MRSHNAATGLRRFAADTRGASMVEYALLLFLVLCIGAIAYRKVGKDVRMAGDMTEAQFLTPH